MIRPRFIHFIFLLIFVASFLLFSKSFTYYFFQDDWFVLNWVRKEDFLSFIKFRTDIIYWRPVSMPLFFAANKMIFGLNPLGFHLTAYGFFLALAVSVYFLFKELLISKKLALFTSFLYSTWHIHFISLSWLSTTSYIMGPLFQVLSFYFFVLFIKEKRFSKWALSFSFFLLGLTSSEFSLVLPVIILVWGIILNNKLVTKYLVPFFAVNLIYLFIRLFIVPIPATGQYQLFVTKQVFYNLMWYVGWLFNIPERFKTLIYFSLPKQTLLNLAEFWKFFVPSFLIGIVASLAIFLNFRKHKRIYLFGALWLILGLLPVIFLTDHAYPLYLSFSGFGFLTVLSASFDKAKKISLIIFSAIWLMSAFASIQFTKMTHWIPNEQAISKSYLEYTKGKILNPPDNSIIIFGPPDREFSEKKNILVLDSEDTLKLSLNAEDAAQVVYDNSFLKSVFLKQQPTSVPHAPNVYLIFPKEND